MSCRHAELLREFPAATRGAFWLLVAAHEYFKVDLAIIAGEFINWHYYCSVRQNQSNMPILR